MAGDGGAAYDRADSALLAPKGIASRSSEQVLRYRIDAERYLGGVTLVNEDRTAAGRFMQSIRGTEVHVRFHAQVQTADWTLASTFEIKKSLSPGASVTIPWKDVGMMKGPGEVEITASNLGALYTGVIVGARRIP